MLKKIMIIFFTITRKILFVSIIVLLVYYVCTKSYSIVYDFITEPNINNEVVKDVEVTIEKGSNTTEIAKILKEAGVIKNNIAFVLRVKAFSKYEEKFRYGTYVLNTGMSEEEIMKVLTTKGEQRESIEIIIPEGYSLQEIAAYLQTKDICKISDFYKAVDQVGYDYPFFNEIPMDRKYRLQGYLFPDTYKIYKDSTPKSIVSTMLSRFNEKFKKEYYDRAKELNMTIDDVINLAALIEKEAKLDDERPIISGVIYNRIKEEMPLQIDASLQYIKGNGIFRNTKIFNNDLEIDSPYNTYKYTGLPDGPICNPGEKSIIAALYPEEHDYLYYVLKDKETGEHVFNETYDEHIKDKNKYIK